MPDRTYRSMQVAERGAPLTGVDVPIREPGPGQVRVAVQTCGLTSMGNPWQPHTVRDLLKSRQ